MPGHRSVLQNLSGMAHHPVCALYLIASTLGLSIGPQALEQCVPSASSVCRSIDWSSATPLGVPMHHRRSEMAALSTWGSLTSTMSGSELGRDPGPEPGKESHDARPATTAPDTPP